MASFLFKTEPGEYSFGDLVREKKAVWSGVTNNTALLHLRMCRKGDEVFVYHTGSERRIVGLARVTKGAFEDPDRPGLNGKGEPKFAVVELSSVRAASSALSLEMMKVDERFAGFDLLRISRLSVMPVPMEVDAAIRELAGF